jgi:tetratricopeptide (TPR) repeat protein
MELSDGVYRLKSKGDGILIPSTIQDVIMARGDSLPEAAKELLRMGSAIEREFSYLLIKRTAEMTERELASALTILKETELIYQRGVIPDSTYIFRHALTMEVLYGSILSDKKIALHQKIGETIEGMYKDTIEEHSQTLARHFTESRQQEKAAKYSEKAARIARRSGAYTDAIDYYKKNIIALEQLPRSVAVEKQIIDARTILAGHYMSLSRCIDAKLAVDPILDKAVALNYTKRLPGIYAALGSYCWAIEDFNNASKYFSQALAEAKKISDFFSLWSVNIYLGATFFSISKFEESLTCFKEALKLNEIAGNLPGISSVKATMSALTLNYAGLITEAFRLSKEAVDLSEVCGDTHTKSLGYTAYGSVCFFKGDFEKAQKILVQAINFCNKSGYKDWQLWSEIWLANTYYHTKNFEEAEKFYTIARATRIETGQHSSWDIQLDLLTIRTALKQKRAINIPALLSDYCKKNNYPLFEGGLYAIAADILINSDSDRLDEAESLIKDAISVDEKNGTRWSLARDFHIYAKLYWRKKDKFNAIEKLTRGIEIMEECGADGWVKRWEDLLLEYNKP